MMTAERRYFTKGADLKLAESADFWRGLNPSLAITDDPFKDAPIYDVPKSELDQAVTQVSEEGYLQTTPVIPADVCKGLAQAMHNIIQAGQHPLFLSVYDSYWQVMKGISKVMEPVLGPDFKLLGEFWTWCISPETSERGWSPHRDHQFSIPTLRPDNRPVIVTTWLPFTDATTLNGCMYMMPFDRDLDLDTVDDPRIKPIRNMQDVRALPAAAGSVLAWNQYVLHWGSRCSKWAKGPRISTGIYFQSGDIPRFYPKIIEFGRPFSFADRMAYIGSSFLNYHGEHEWPEELIDMCLRWVSIMPEAAKIVPDYLRDRLPVASS